MATMRCRSVVGVVHASAWQWAAVLAAILLIGGCAAGLAAKPGKTVPTQPAPGVSQWKLPKGGYLRQQRVATLWGPAEVLISNDLAHVAVIHQGGRKQRVTVDDKTEGPEYDKATFPEHDGPGFSPDGMPVLYAGANEGRWRLVASGRAGPECDAWLYQTACGPDRTGIAYTAVEISRKAFVSIDGRAGPVYDDVSWPVLSDDRKRLAYVACKGRGPERKEMPVIDGKQGPEYDQVAPDSLAFDSSGRRVAYAARSGQKWRVVIDGQPGPQYDRIGEGPIIFLSDGKAVAYAAMAERKWVVSVRNTPAARVQLYYPGLSSRNLSAQPRLSPPTLSISPASSSVAIVAGPGSRVGWSQENCPACSLTPKPPPGQAQPCEALREARCQPSAQEYIDTSLEWIAPMKLCEAAPFREA
jgi:hypothetical protein